MAGRQRTAGVAVAGLERELALLDREIVARPTNVVPYEVFRARRAAAGYVEHWVDDVREAVRLGRTDPIVAATRKQAWRLELGAATENADAFNGARAATLRTADAADLWKEWNAALDERSCYICEGAHGTVVRLHEDFPEGEPPIHPQCRCTWLALPTEMVELSRYAYAA